MEIQSTNGSKTRIKPDSTTIFGRKNLPNTNDLTISRNHIQFSPINQSNPRVSFQVIGKNPIWIYSKNEMGKKVKTFKRFEMGELGNGDLFCVSGKNPDWFMVKEVKDDILGEKCEIFEGEFSECLEGNFEDDSNFDFKLDSDDVSNIDPIQEFGFLVVGHEFDQYPKKMIRDIKNWDWFLTDPIGGSDSEDDESGNTKRNKGKSRKRKKTSGDEDVDEEWTAESEGEEPTTKVRKPKYHTRSREPSISATKKTSSATGSKHEEVEEDEEFDEEVDETLGGFIVDDENVEEDEEGNEIDDDDEEEFVEDEDEELEV